MSRPTCVLVIGLPRSGTSMTAGVLHRLGVSMTPYGYCPAGEHNPRGYYEDEFFAEFHCRAMGTTRSDFLLTDPKQVYVWSEETVRFYKAGIMDREDKFTHWGVKDPRLVLFVHYFAALCESHLKVIEVMRRPEAVKASLGRVWAADGVEQSEAETGRIYQDWLLAKERAVLFLYLFGAQIMKVNYEAVLENPESQVENICNFVGVEPTQEAIAFIDPALNHGGKAS